MSGLAPQVMAMLPRRLATLVLVTLVVATALVGASAPAAASDHVDKNARMSLNDGHAGTTPEPGAGTLPLVVLGAVALVCFFEVRRSTTTL